MCVGIYFYVKKQTDSSNLVIELNDAITTLSNNNTKLTELNRVNIGEIERLTDINTTIEGNYKKLRDENFIAREQLKESREQLDNIGQSINSLSAGAQEAEELVRDIIRIFTEIQAALEE